MIFRFAQPEWLWLLLLLPVLFFLQGKRGRSASVTFSAVGLAAQVSAFVRRRPGKWRFVPRWLALALLIAALARPQSGSETRTTEASGIDIVLAIDLSPSMWAHDFRQGGARIDRLKVVKGVVREFIEDRPHDRIGMVAFAGDPYLVSPLTLNHDWLLNRLEELEIGMIDSGTAIGSAIASGANRLRDIPAKSRVMILMTDGASNAGQVEPVPAAEAASRFGIKIYAIGVGREGMVPFPARFSRDGKPMRDSRGIIRLVNRRSEIDLPTLKEVADISNGRYYHATDTENLQSIYDEIDQLEKTEANLTINRLYSEAFMWPLGLSLGLLLIDFLLRQTRFRRLPQ